MASGRRSMGGGEASAKKQDAPRVKAKPQTPATAVAPKQERVRVWWEPTEDKTRTGFGGAYWPAKVLSMNDKKGTIRVRYDNGEEHNVDPEHVTPVEAPVEFGQEKTQLQKGEFCEVHNASITDPGAWLGKVIKYDSEKDTYTVEYPFHDSKPEKVKGERVRRARVLEDDEWRLIRPHQDWEDGEVASPRELELIAEDELQQHIEEEANVDGKRSSGSKKAVKKKRSSTAPEPASSKPAKAAKTGSASGSKAGVALEASAPAGMTAVQLKLEVLPNGRCCFVPSNSSEAFSAFLPVKAMAKFNSKAKK